MAVGGGVEEFDVWLSGELNAFQADESVFGSYIRGILEGEESADEKKEALEAILSEIKKTDISKLCHEIMEKWKGSSHAASVLEVSEDVDVRLAKLMENQALTAAVRNSNYTDEEKRIREAIVSQYGQYSDDEPDNVGQKSAATSSTQSNGLEKNLNAALVAQAEREKREQSKLESQRKKEKDKEDRERQRQAQADKKEKRKTHKAERRR